MKAIFILILILASSSFAKKEEVKTITGQEIIQKVQKIYGNTNDFKANFKQVIHYSGLKRKGESSGSVFFKKPNKVKWQQIKPEKSSYISNGKIMWLYMPEDDQVFINKNLKEVVDKIGLLFLSQESKIYQNYTISLLKKEKIPTEKSNKNNKTKTKYTKKSLEENVSGEEVLFEFLPKNKDNFLKAIFKVDASNFLISKVMLYDLARNKTVINLSDIRLNLGTKDSFFEFKPPKNAEVYSSDSY